MASGDMSKRAHLWLRLSAIAVIAAAAAIPRASAVAERPVAPTLTASSAVVDGSHHVAGLGPSEGMGASVMGASVMTASAMNALPLAEGATDSLADALTVRSPVSPALDGPLRKDAKPPVARR
jgi:hypothetical protein